ncbi:MAG: FlgD immunoglobulin-like domain containing protein, partial [bacterium]
VRDGTVIEGEDVITIVGNTGNSQTAKSTDPPLTLNPSAAAPETFALLQNHPNPFNPTTMIRFDVPAGGGAVTLRVYDVTGRLVRTLVDGMQTPGEKTIAWDGRNDAGVPVASGAYLYRLTGPRFEQTRKMLFLK